MATSIPESRDGVRRATAGHLEPLGRVLEFMRSMWAVEHQLGLASKRMERALGVTGPQRLVIRVVARQPGIFAGELAQALHVHPSTLTGVLARLSGKNIVTRTPDPDDGRRVRLRLTAKGERLASARSGTVEEQFRRALARAGPADVSATERVLKLIATALAARVVKHAAVSPSPERTPSRSHASSARRATLSRI